MDWLRLAEKFRRCRILVVGDFNQDAAEPLSLRHLGAQVVAVGLGTAAVKKRLQQHGIDAAGIGRFRGAVCDAALIRLGGCDAVLFGAGEWDTEREALLDEERELAIMDGRSPRPFISAQDPRYLFLRSAPERAAFGLARAAGADFETAREFASGHASGYKNENSRTRSGGRGGPAAAKRGNAR